MSGGRPPSVDVNPAPATWSQAERIAQMEQSVPTYALFSRAAATSSRTYVGIMDLDTGDYAIVSSGGLPECSTFCAEGNAYQALGRPVNYYISKAWTVESQDGALTAVPKDACIYCQNDYPAEAWAPDVTMQPGGRFASN